MKVLIKRDAFLTDYEVLKHIYEDELEEKYTTDSIKSRQPVNENFRTIQFELRKYLEGLPAKKQTAQQVCKLTKELENYPLTKVERLMIVNSRPDTLVELYALIEECEERFNLEQLQQILDRIHNEMPLNFQEN
ncbi:unnamed protein product [Pneumocystis jirovecii]|uniref:DNA-directed RNA polymerase III subunit RPC9 n=2 Tax=Pneumocystis jirovecii TaxID=42068 RepID=L0PA11_PNEJI|nr:uncharacterized protein T551_03250 [Pneumocystis jirovecii RU7]KTW27256.1 hypothetical protein T551_03250 [Pneumocystis jirovecii RU7]CCJ28909.1 unnamed protein product [Pneumocystis jirovecii]